jgi:riboflavin kinase/FMN adenylyltransferase
MTLPLQFASADLAVLPPSPLHLAIGMFDGVHLGHRAVIEAAVQSARRSGGLAAVLTFRPHPSVLFRPAQPTRLIQDLPTLVWVLGGLGVDAVITQPFTPEFARIEAEDFLPWLRQRLPGLSTVYVGQKWRFGARRRGDVDLLVRTGRAAQVSVFSAPPVNLDGEPVNSTRIRLLLEAGEMARANTLLGYSYFAHGSVVPGRQLGRTLGFPTLNLPWAPDLRPRFGVYAVRVTGAKAPAPLRGVANYGVRPTVEAEAAAPLLEVHLLDAGPFDAGDPLRVEWLDFLRPEMKFAGVGELREQIARDVAAARAR